jgi:putative tryptophan/tyrosine transport system substrate-binding protein
VNRRQLITLLGGAAAAPLLRWPPTARAQQSGGMRRIGVLSNLAADNPESQARVGAFLQGLQEVGWAIGRNVRIEYRWATDAADMPRYAAELVALAPDVILANANPSVWALQRVTRALPIVFVASTEPVGSGLVESMARPGGNATGFASAEFGTSAKWLELLKEIAPGVMRAAVLEDPLTGGAGQFAAIQTVAGSVGVAVSPLAVSDVGEIERSVAAFARASNGGIIVTRGPQTITQRDLIVRLAAQHRLPAVYPLRLFVAAGGLISYWADIVDQYRRAARYVDRILKGEKPADLPVQAPVKYELVINLKTAKALGLELPATVLARADEVIE